MKIAIDVSQILFGTGVSHYRDNLVKHLLKIDRENEYLLYGGSLRRFTELKNRTKEYLGKATAKIFPIPPSAANFVWNRLHVFPIEFLTGKIDVLHSSDWIQPPSAAFKVTTIHDLFPLKFSRLTDPQIVSAHKARLAWVGKEVDRIIVPSEATKKDLLEGGFAEKLIRVIPEAPNQAWVGKELVEKVKRKNKIFGKYLLSVGVSPRKNTQKIIEAFHLAKAKENLKLILVGRPNFIKIEEQRDVRVLGHVAPDEISALYTGAEALVYPSLYEGFGVPILDAFNCRCPVVTSNFSSMPEVAGDAAVLVDPYSTNSIVEGIKEALSTRQTLIKKGLAQVKKFSWDKTANETLKVYQEAI